MQIYDFFVIQQNTVRDLHTLHHFCTEQIQEVASLIEKATSCDILKIYFLFEEFLSEFFQASAPSEEFVSCAFRYVGVGIVTSILEFLSCFTNAVGSFL